MTTDTPNIQQLHKDHLELLMCKIEEIKVHGQAYFARKMATDKRLYDQARKELNQYLVILKKRGYSGDRFKVKGVQGELIR